MLSSVLLTSMLKNALPTSFCLYLKFKSALKTINQLFIKDKYNTLVIIIVDEGCPGYIVDLEVWGQLWHVFGARDLNVALDLDDKKYILP